MQLNLLVIRTAQPAELAAFYQKLGIAFDYHQHGQGPFHYSAILDQLVLEIYPLLKGQLQADNSLRLGFEIDRLDELIRRLEADKIAILRAPALSKWGYSAIIADPDGRKVELKETGRISV